MATSHPLPAKALLDLLGHLPGSAPPTDAQADKAITEFVAHLVTLDKRHNRKPVSERYLIDQVFGRSRLFQNDVEVRHFCRCHLHIALKQLSKLVTTLKGSTGSVTGASLITWNDTIRDYILDLVEVVPFLQRDQPDYVYLNAHKNAGLHSWQVFGLAHGLAYQSTLQVGSLEHKAAQIAAIAVLRQALELRFVRLISVYPQDKKGKPPKLKHGFHQEFIVANPQFFLTQEFSIADLKPVYDWCSEIVHQAYQPYAWQIAWALELSGRLLNSRSAAGAWNIANGVEIIDVQGMQTAFESHFMEKYDHGEWKMTRLRPEALVRNWTDEMAFTGASFLPVQGRS